MATPNFCVKFTNQADITIAVDVEAKDASAAIVAASNRLLDVLDGPPEGFKPVEVYPVEIR